MVLSFKDRSDIVKTAKACAICLHPSHTADRCYNKDKDKYICGVNGCQSHHHPCLHGSRDSCECVTETAELNKSVDAL